ncbi:hypothetical protein DFH06DRAFT_990097 [Mycena polygramma]|nr:hypothetical protein DFH06DRAFT_990097 [Mycena polygramma]
MHDCLRIAELVDMICSQFHSASAFFHSDPEDQRALAAVARTCMTFRDTALDHLWRSTTLGQLLTSCMPSDLWVFDTVERMGSLQRRVRLRRPICDSDWQRVRVYAPRIRKLISGRDAWYLHHIFPALSLAFPESLLQNMRDLDWCHSHCFHYIHILLRPSITRISFEYLSTSDCSLFPRLAELCPKLADISISATDDLAVDRAVSRFVARLRLLETISVPWLEQDALEHLSKLPTLKSLHMEQPREAFAVSKARIVPAFTALRQLFVFEATLDYMTSLLLRMCSDVPLETLTVHLDNDHHPPATDVQAFLTAVTESVSHSTLRHFRLEGFGWGRYKPDPVTSLIQPDTLVLLLCFENLTSLHLTSALGFDLDDATVSRMARAWPRIECLHLQLLDSARRPRATLASLNSIAWHCPRIVALTIAFDGSVIPPPSASDGVVVRNESLREMNVLHSPITTPGAVGRLFSCVFPNLTEIHTTQRQFMDNGELHEANRHQRWWAEVEAYCRYL